MTFELTSERLQDIAVNCVTQFISKQASLNEAIAKEAMDLELNSDQTKRVIEASNTIAYLRQLEKSADRTFEFELADYGKVMANMCMPEDMKKEAGTPPWLDKDKDKKEDNKEDDKGEKKDPKDKDDSKEENFKGEDFGKNKDKKSEKSDDDSDEEKQEKKAMLMQAYFQTINTLEKMAYDEVGLQMSLVEAAGRVRKDPHGLEKLAHVVEGENLNKLSKLCGIEKRAQEDLVFVQSDLKQAVELYSLYKQANEFIEKKAKLTDFALRSEQVLFKSAADLEKQAYGILFKGLKAIPSLIKKAPASIAKGIGESIGRPMGSVAAKVGSTGVDAAKNIGSFGAAAEKAGYSSTSEGVKAYDKISKTQGPLAAQKKFDGRKPSFLVHRVGAGTMLTATAGLGLEHKNNVKDLY